MSKPPWQQGEYLQDSAREWDRHGFGRGDAGQRKQKGERRFEGSDPTYSDGNACHKNRQRNGHHETNNSHVNTNSPCDQPRLHNHQQLLGQSQRGKTHQTSRIIPIGAIRLVKFPELHRNTIVSEPAENTIMD